MREFERFPATGETLYAGGGPALLFGADGPRRAEIAAMLTHDGVRLAAALTLKAAVKRLDEQAALALAWVECADGEQLDDALLSRLEAQAAVGTAVVVSIPPGEIDAAVAALTHPAIQLLVDPDPVERAGALAVALAGRGQPTAVSDVGRDNAVRLRQISDEMGRIAATLARLSSGPDQTSKPVLKPSDVAGDVPPVDIETVRQVIRARRLRSRFFDEDLFADPAWDMLLDLLQAEIAQHRVPVSSLCIAAAVPATTALRWIKSMTDAGLLIRRADPHDGRRVFVELAPMASDALRRYFGEVGAQAVI
jgi:DNA-binding MarR family transcriptional regulator